MLILTNSCIWGLYLLSPYEYFLQNIVDISGYKFKTQIGFVHLSRCISNLFRNKVYQNY